MSPKLWLPVMLVALFAGAAEVAGAYNRPPPRDTLTVSLARDSNPSTPQQVHISLAGENGIRISWVTNTHTPPTVYYGISSGKYDHSANGTISYEYLTYTSGEIHDVVIGPLNPNTVYYCCFARGDLGQTGWTKSTLDHISQRNYDVLLLPGDLSYADMLRTTLVDANYAKWSWHRNQDDESVEADSVSIINLANNPACNKLEI